MNKAKLNNEVVKIVSFVNNNGEVTAKSKYLIDLLLKGISLEKIGCNFVVNRQFKNDTSKYIAKNNTSIQYEKTSNSITDREIINILNLYNSTVAKDFTLYCYYNKNENIVVQKFPIDSNAKNFYISDKNAVTNETLKVYNDIDNSYKIEVVQKKGKRLFNDNDKKEVLANFNNALKRLDKELFSLSSDDKKETKKVSA